MNESRKPSSNPWIGVVVLAVLFGGYVGAYYVTVEPYVHSRVAGTVIRLPTYSIPGSSERWQWSVDTLLDVVFAPMHWLDRRIRPHVWTS